MEFDAAAIKGFAIKGGFPDSLIDTAVRIAFAESGGNPVSHNTKGHDNSYGLWQINMYGDMGPERRAKFNLRNNDVLFDPTTNARVAYQIYRDSGWDAWTTYTSGKYKSEEITKRMNGISTAVVETDTQADAVNPVSQVANAVSNFSSNIIKFGANATAVFIGVTILIVGFLLLIFGSHGVEKAAKHVTTKVKDGVNT